MLNICPHGKLAFVNTVGGSFYFYTVFSQCWGAAGNSPKGVNVLADLLVPYWNISQVQLS